MIAPGQQGCSAAAPASLAWKIGPSAARSSRSALAWGLPSTSRGSLPRPDVPEASGESVPRSIGPPPDPIYLLRPHAARGRSRPCIPADCGWCTRGTQRRSRIRPPARCGQRAASVRKTSRRRGGPRPQGFATAAAQHPDKEVIVHWRSANPSGCGCRQATAGGPFFRASGRGAGGLMRLRRFTRGPQRP